MPEPPRSRIPNSGPRRQTRGPGAYSVRWYAEIDQGGIGAGHRDGRLPTTGSHHGRSRTGRPGRSEVVGTPIAGGHGGGMACSGPEPSARRCDIRHGTRIHRRSAAFANGTARRGRRGSSRPKGGIGNQTSLVSTSGTAVRSPARCSRSDRSSSAQVARTSAESWDGARTGASWSTTTTTGPIVMRLCGTWQPTCGRPGVSTTRALAASPRAPTSSSVEARARQK